ncbi:MAG: 4-amino-4-deoxy-L-arabinose transferase-like glycosyltransferase [Planctomycetota bacterium]|jgi:4-amino-4-deoxy-L-arabinose transferase-like glycosyltransferase
MDAEITRSPRWHWPLLILLGLPVFFYGLSSYSVVNGDEGIYHSISVAMLETGNWFHLDYYGQHRVYDTFMNAPLHYWGRAVLIALFGDNLWTMRLISAVFGLLTVLAVYRLAARLDSTGDKRVALFAALILLTCFQFIYLHSARTGELDTIVAFLMIAIAISFLRAVEDKRSFVPHHLFLAALLTVKLPVALIPVIAELALFATSPALRSQFKRYVAFGFAVVPLGLVWHVVQAGDLWDEFLAVMSEMSEEASGAKGGGNASGTLLSNFQFYVRTLIFGFFPWSLAVVPALFTAIIAIVRKSKNSETLALRLSLCFAATVWLFFALVSKRFSWYILPALPFLAISVGWWLTKLSRGMCWTGALASALIMSFSVWLEASTNGIHPLADRTPRVPMHTVWRSVDWISVESGFLILLGLLALFFVLANQRWPVQVGRKVGAGLFGVLFLVAAVRVSVPLASLEQVSELDRFYQQVEASRLAGKPIAYPLSIPESMGYLRTKHYFGRRYRMEMRKGPRGSLILITGERQ